MKIFETLRKINFVDENNVFVGYDYCPECCEDFGYWLSYEQGSQKPEETENCNNFVLDGYVFDPAYCKEINYQTDDIQRGLFPFIEFKLVRHGHTDIYLVLYSHHNGYYAHGFEMGIVDEKVLFKGEL